jgi:hypothetical protein
MTTPFVPNHRTHPVQEELIYRFSATNLALDQQFLEKNFAIATELQIAAIGHRTGPPHPVV